MCNCETTLSTSRVCHGWSINGGSGGGDAGSSRFGGGRGYGCSSDVCHCRGGKGGGSSHAIERTILSRSWMPKSQSSGLRTARSTNSRVTTSVLCLGGCPRHVEKRHQRLLRFGTPVKSALTIFQDDHWSHNCIYSV